MSARYEIQWVNGHERLTVYLYNVDSGELTETANAEGRCSITESEGVTTFTIDGDVAMVVGDDGSVTISDTLTDRVPGDLSPRIEFMRYATSVPERMGVLSKTKVLWVPRINQVDALPDTDDMLVLVPGLCAFSRHEFFCQSIQQL